MKRLAKRIFIVIVSIVGILFAVWAVLKINYEIRYAIYIKNIIKEPIIPVKGKILFSSTGREEPYYLFLLENGKISAVKDEDDNSLTDYSKLEKQGLSRIVIRNSCGIGIKEAIISASYTPFDFDVSTDSQTIVFTSRMGGSTYNLYTIDIEGKDLKQITNFSEQQHWFVHGTKFSFDSKKIIFSGQKSYKGIPDHPGIWLITPAGTNLEELTKASHWGGIDPAWSPDSKTIVFCSYPEDAKILKYDLYLMNADGSNIRRITNFEDKFEAIQPCFSPDGTQICFVGKQPGPPTGSELFAVNIDGTNLIRLTPAKQTPHYPYFATDKYPDWGE